MPCEIQTYQLLITLVKPILLAFFSGHFG